MPKPIPSVKSKEKFDILSIATTAYQELEPPFRVAFKVYSYYRFIRLFI